MALRYMLKFKWLSMETTSVPTENLVGKSPDLILVNMIDLMVEI